MDDLTIVTLFFERSEFSFDDKDFEGLPDIGAYIEALDLSQFEPRHMNLKGKEWIYQRVTGQYEKTADGVQAIVRISWSCKEKDEMIEYYDETILYLTSKGVVIDSCESGSHSCENYGKPLDIPC